MYSPRYNITFMGLEKLHPFDAGKWGKVINFLKGKKAPPTPDLDLPPFLLPSLTTPLDLHLPPSSLHPSHPYLDSAPDCLLSCC